MSASVNLYTTGIMAKAMVKDITSEATGFPRQNLLDFNPDTYWKPTNTDNQTIDIELGEAYTVTGFAVWIHNYNTDYNIGSQVIQVLSDDNDDGSYTAVTASCTDTFEAFTVGHPIYFPSDTYGWTEATRRYWRVIIGNMSIVSEISGFFFLVKRVVSIGNQWPEPDALKYYNSRIELPGGRQFITGINSHGITNNILRTYILEGTTWTSTSLYLAFQDCKGSLYPLIMNEGTDYKYVRFNNEGDELSKNQIDYLLYNPTVIFRQIPYIADGETY